MSDFRKKAIIQYFDHNGCPYFCFLGNVSKYGNHVTLGGKRAHQLSDDLLAAEEKKNKQKKKQQFLLKLRGFLDIGDGASKEKNSFIEFI